MGQMSSGKFAFDVFSNYSDFRLCVAEASTFGFRGVRAFLLTWSGAIVFLSQPIRRSCNFCPGNIKITAEHLFSCSSTSLSNLFSIRNAVQRKDFSFIVELRLHIYFSFRFRYQFSIFDDDDDDAALFDLIPPLE